MPAHADDLNSTETTRLTRRGSRHAPPEMRRAQLLEAAIRCFASQGYHATTMDTIAEESGLSKGSLYRFFKSKDDLLLAIFDQFEGEMNQRWASLDTGEDPLRQLREYGQTLADQMTAQPELSVVWLEFLRHKTAQEHLRKHHASARKRLTASIRAGVRNGKINGVPATQAADALLMILEGLLIMAVADPDFDPSRRFAGAWRVVEAGLRPPGSAD